MIIMKMTRAVRKEAYESEASCFADGDVLMSRPFPAVIRLASAVQVQTNKFWEQQGLWTN